MVPIFKTYKIQILLMSWRMRNDERNCVLSLPEMGAFFNPCKFENITERIQKIEIPICVKIYN